MTSMKKRLLWILLAVWIMIGAMIIISIIVIEKHDYYTCQAIMTKIVMIYVFASCIMSGIIYRLRKKGR